MSKPTIKYRENSPVAPELPEYQTAGAAGADVRSAERVWIRPGEFMLVKTGYDVEVPAGYVLDVRSRSGLAAKKGVFVLNAPGTIDEDYRGPLGVILANLGKEEVCIDEGDRIAQLVLLPVVQANHVLVDELSSTERGTGGFGSTGS